MPQIARGRLPGQTATQKPILNLNACRQKLPVQVFVLSESPETLKSNSPVLPRKSVAKKWQSIFLSQAHWLVDSNSRQSTHCMLLQAELGIS